MKRMILAACALAMLSLTGCKDDPAESRPQEPQSTEGIYNPEAKINYITFDDETVPEVWVWNGDKLEVVGDADNCGGMTERIVFEYTGNRVSAITETVEGQETETRITYDSKNYISNVSVYIAGAQMLGLNVTHNAGKRISHIDANVNAEYVNTLLGMLIGGDGEMFARTPLARLVGTQIAELIVRTSASQGLASKLTVNSISLYLDLEWEGNNVARVFVNADINAGVTMDDISQFIDLEQYVGELASLISAIQGEQQLALSIRDTMELFYDNHTNPLQGYLGEISPSTLSANNCTDIYNYGNAHFNLIINIPFVGQYPLERDQPLNYVKEYYYTYTSEGYPEEVTDNDGKTSIYHYIQ